jgi:transposase
MLPPNNMADRLLSQEEGISEAALHKWRAEARGKGLTLPDSDAGPEGWSPREKFAAVLDTAALNEADFGEYSRTRGLYPATGAVGRSACEQANDWNRASTARLVRATKDGKKRVKDLERELARKDKALADTAALLVLRKKGSGDLGRRRGRMISTPYRETAIALINDAVTAGTRCTNACAVLEISDHTLRRWTKDGQIHADQRPLAPRPKQRNKLRAAERAAVLEACSSKQFVSLPPSQIVPKLVDQVRYLASESSFYRILRAKRQQHHLGRARPPIRRTPPPAARQVCPVRSGLGT